MLEIHASRAHLDPANTNDYAVRQRLNIVRQVDTNGAFRLIDNPLAEEVTSILDILDFLDILVTAHSFFTLYEPKPTPADQDGKVLDYVTSKLGMSQSRDLVSPFDLASLKFRPFRLNRNKTPGSEGIPVEIYQATWSVTARSSPTC